LSDVCFSVTAARSVAPGDTIVVDVWAHLSGDREEVIGRARDAIGGTDVLAKTKGGFTIASRTLLSIRVRIDGLVVDEPEDVILWTGSIANADFAIGVPRDATGGPHAGFATVHVAGLRLATIRFVIVVGAREDPVEPMGAATVAHRSAFASYASADRDEVLGRVQGMQKAAPHLEVFVDVASLRSGQRWAQELERVIPASDVFYLFWSGHARESDWVTREWQCALRSRGVDFIDPVPLVSPTEVPPPAQLQALHFNDWVLAFQSSQQSARQDHDHVTSPPDNTRSATQPGAAQGQHRGGES
jgi:hypothetical protein